MFNLASYNSNSTCCSFELAVFKWLNAFEHSFLQHQQKQQKTNIFNPLPSAWNAAIKFIFYSRSSFHPIDILDGKLNLPRPARHAPVHQANVGHIAAYIKCMYAVIIIGD